MTFRFVSNVDGIDFVEATRDLDPAETLFIVVLQDLHDAGDHDQCRERARLAAQRLGRRQAGRGEALRRGLDQCAEGVRVRHRHRQHVRLLGLGGRPLFHVLGDRPLHHARHRPGQLPRDARRLPPDGRALPHRAVRAEPAGPHGPAGHLVHRLLRRADHCGAALRAIPEALPGLPAAVDDGEQRQARHTRWGGGGLRHRRRLLGRAGHQRPAFVLPVDPPGHAAHPVRLHRLRPGADPAGPPPRHAAGQRLRAKRGAGVRPDARAGQGRGRAGLARAAPGLRGQPPLQHHPRRAAHAGNAGRARRALRAQRLHPRRHLEHRLVRSVGRATWARCWPSASSPNWRARTPPRSTTTAPPTTSSAVTGR